MEYIYVDFLRYLGYNVLEQLTPSSCAVFKIEQEGKVMIAKIGDQMYSGLAYKHVFREHEILESATGITGVPQGISFRTYQGNQPLALLIKEYIEGEPLSRNLDSATQKDSIKALISSFHTKGMASLDLERPSNIIISPQGQPYLIDLGSIFFSSELSADRFEAHKNDDLNSLEALFSE